MTKKIKHFFGIQRMPPSSSFDPGSLNETLGNSMQKNPLRPSVQ